MIHSLGLGVPFGRVQGRSREVPAKEVPYHNWNLENPGGILNHFSMGSSKGLIYSLPPSQLQMAEPDEFEKMQKNFLKREGGPLFEMEDSQLG